MLFRGRAAAKSAPSAAPRVTYVALWMGGRRGLDRPRRPLPLAPLRDAARHSEEDRHPRRQRGYREQIGGHAQVAL